MVEALAHLGAVNPEEAQQSRRLLDRAERIARLLGT